MSMKTTEIQHLQSEAYKSRLFSFIKEVVRNYYKASDNVYEIKTRKREILKIRHYAIYFCLTSTKTGPSELASYFGCDHATVIHIKRKLSGYLEFDRELKKEFNEIRTLIKAKSMEEREDSDDIYFIDLNNVHSIKHKDGKAIVLTGFTDEEVENMRFLTSFDGLDLFNYWGNPSKVIRKHENTGMYILDSNK